MALISLLHPSRGRPEKSFKNAIEWVKKAGCAVELIVSTDVSDLSDYHFYYGQVFYGIYSRFENETNCAPYLMQNDNSSVVEATNHAAKKSKGDILIYLSDDFKCPDNWGQLILKEFEGVTEPMLLKVDDCLQGFHVPVLTIPIMNRALYQRLGYFWHPAYKSMFVDCDLYETAKKLGALTFSPQLKFPHEHVSNGKAPDDETYRRSAANWDQGKKMFEIRKKAGFPV